MTIGLLKGSGSNPMLFRTCCESLLELFRRQTVTKLSCIRIGSIQEETLQSIVVYADEVASKTSNADRSLALGLILVKKNRRKKTY